MAIPFIMGALLTGRGISNMMQADANREYAMEKNSKAFNKMANAQREVQETHEFATESLIKLANRKKGIINTSIKRFIDVYENLQKVKFVEKKELQEFIARPVMQETVQTLNKAISVAGIGMSNYEIVNSLLCLSITKLVVNDSEREVKVARMRQKQAAVIASKAETNIIALKTIIDKANRITDILTKLNKVFYRTIDRLEEIIEEKGCDGRSYTEHDYDHIRNCLNFADAVKKIIDAPIFAEDGEITEQAQKALALGNEFIAKIEKIQ